jgi:sterol desaturase/sphingolipid hydroxylase (fatty acid hydroxylase superfamily)
MSMTLPIVPAAITLGSLAAVALWEVCRRRRKPRFPAARRRTGNLGIWLFNTTLATALFSEPERFWVMPGWAGWVAGFLLLDLSAYWVHRLYHTTPLWRLHALHHSDPDVDVTTAVRHHPAEYLLTAAGYWLALRVLGIPGVVVALHGTLTFALAAATHGNVRWPRWAERALTPVVITLEAHLVHHSVSDANANFGTVFSIWDRAFGTYRQPSGEPVFGVRELDARRACKPAQMLLTPLRI